MKRVLICLLCGLLLCSGLTAAAEQTPAVVTTTASASTLRRGETVTLTVSVADSPSVTSMAIRMAGGWDTNVFEYVSAKWLVEGPLNDVDENKLNAAIAFKNATVPTGNVFEITLKVKDTTGIGHTVLTAGAVLGSALVAEPIPVALVSCEVEIICDHEWQAADCAYPERCKYCGTTKGEPLGHSYEGNTCTRCGLTKEAASTTTTTTVPTKVITTTVAVNGTTAAGKPTAVAPTEDAASASRSETAGTTTMMVGGVTTTTQGGAAATATASDGSGSVVTRPVTTTATDAQGSVITDPTTTATDEDGTVITYPDIEKESVPTIPGEEDGDRTWVFVLLCVLVALAIGGGVVAVVLRKKQN